MNEHRVHSIEQSQTLLRHYQQGYDEQGPDSILGYQAEAEGHEELRNQWGLNEVQRFSENAASRTT